VDYIIKSALVKKKVQNFLAFWEADGDLFLRTSARFQELLKLEPVAHWVHHCVLQRGHDAPFFVALRLVVGFGAPIIKARQREGRDERIGNHLVFAHGLCRGPLGAGSFFWQTKIFDRARLEDGIRSHLFYTFYPTLLAKLRFFIDKFRAADIDGVLWLHGYGNVFERTLVAGEQIDIEPGGWLSMDSGVKMETTMQRLSVGTLAGMNLVMKRMRRSLVCSGFSSLDQHSSYVSVLAGLLLFGFGRSLFISPNASSVMSSVPAERGGVPRTAGRLAGRDAYWLPTPLTRVRMAKRYGFEVMKRVWRSFPPKHTLVDWRFGVCIHSISWPALSKT
jgi:hypothetical protein